MSRIYPSYFKLHVRWLPSFTPVTYWCKLLGIRSVAAFLQLEYLGYSSGSIRWRADLVP
ncbi:hypothetical protein RF657_00065 [Yersinia rochesterensis]|uniref:hypothetical protein n=1 Tax=Yersinia rochesterensis TaxID=1604335 RepID=UPI0025AA74FD|nr:hypothetical protein [Yersinia rochesterensis]MDN0106046.1 hypothetical protein [Yersinia rochesterensis]MDR5016800.1 hypothetical protein [Yersinia rochesterensis]